MRTILTGILASGLLALSFPAVGHAERPATQREAASIARSANVPKGCIRARIATDATWGVWEFRSPLKGACAKAAQRAGVEQAAVFVHRTDGRWRRRGAASDCGRPKNVPRTIWRELVVACKDYDDEGRPLSDGR